MRPNPSADIDELLQALPPEASRRTFSEPWQAQAFAITVALHKQGLFTWPEWAQTLGREIKDAQAQGDPDLGDTYYLHWLAAIERLLQDKGVANRDKLVTYRDAWHRAANRTPHGNPIVLLPEDFD